MKLNIFLVTAVAAGKRKSKPNRPHRAGNAVRSSPTVCAGDWVDVGNAGTSGYIDIDNYPNNANCFVDVVADETCLEVTTTVVHAGIEHETYWNEWKPKGGHNMLNPVIDCSFDKFWFNDYDKEEVSCGCTEGNFELGQGCNDNLSYYDQAEMDDYEQEYGHAYDYFPYALSDPRINSLSATNLHDRIFMTNSFKFNFVTDYLHAMGNLRIEWNCTKVAPTTPVHPIDRLRQVVQFSGQVLDNFFGSHKRISNWKRKFAANAFRMNRSYDRCGEDPVVEPEDEWKSFDDSNFTVAMNDVTSGFTKWADIYMANCNGHKTQSHHKKRMQKWNHKLQQIQNNL